MVPLAIKPTPTGKPYRLCPLYPDLAFSPTGLFTPDQCVPIDPFLKVTDMPPWGQLPAPAGMGAELNVDARFSH